MPPQNQSLTAPRSEPHSSGALTAVIATFLFAVIAIGGAHYLGYVSFTTTPAAENNTPNATVSSIREGIYSLSGRGAMRSTYSGTITIMKRAGVSNVYDLAWNVGAGQQQIGVGILENGVLSVGYVDVTGGATNDAGSVAYVVADNSHMQGTWISMQADSEVGTEDLTWLSMQ